MTINWRIVLVFAVVLIIVFAWLLIANADLRARLATAQAENTVLHISNAAFKADVEKQNRAVDALQKNAARHPLRNAWLKKNAARDAAKYMADAARIEKQRPVGSDCQSAAMLMDAYIGGVK